MSVLQNDRLIKALLRQEVDRTPIWVMRQAGRYLPEYRELRKKARNFVEFCKSPELACEATLQPFARFDLDAAIIFSDILTVVDALGFDLRYVENEGPVILDPVQTSQDLKGLSATAALDKLQYVFDAVSVTSKALANKVPLIGFAGSPWTVACYMISGKNQKQFQHARLMLYANPELVHQLLELLTEVTILYLNEQVKAGARALMVFDSWGGLLSNLTYSQFSLDYMQKIGAGVIREYENQKIPLIFFTKNGGCWLEQLAESNCDAIGLDWTVNLANARETVAGRKALQGNLDPLALYGTPESVRSAVKNIIDQYGQHPGHVFNLGHGIDKDTPIPNVEALVAAVHEFSQR